MNTVASIVLAAGSGTRFGHSMNKVWLQLNGKHIISRSLENSRSSFSHVRSILVINPDDEKFAREALAKDGALTNTEIVHGGAIPTIALDPREMDSARSETVARVQTPQGFRAQQLLAAYEKAAMAGFVGADTAACMEEFFPEVKTVAVPGDIFNIKITYPQDLAIAELLVPVQ